MEQRQGLGEDGGVGSPAERTHGSASGDEAHVTWPPDQQQAPEQTTNHGAAAPVAVTTERAQSPPVPGPASTVPGSLA